MESTAITLKDITIRLCRLNLPKMIVVTGSGAKSNLWLKIKSETVGIKVITIDCSETACHGAALVVETTIK